MFKIEDLLYNNFSVYPDEVREYLERFSDNLRKALKEELINCITEEMLANAKENEENFKIQLSNILNNGHKGYNTMSTKALLDLYLEFKREEDFMLLLEKVSRGL
ncbi:hypothetical protein [Clostridium tetani]|uniref:CdiI immunity protein domain-containing protein n=1 Tax=Clostridium tetani TaxID=1513 RepID=A0ABY0EM32_CLOTA|nr:hypothetical protein [Clostridium tetani]CDI49250.1 hypothetical protein BN906_01245 [Clostridium tetani 12124569]KHO39450.1 hypothetical protein OR62_05925 [Clostridium tetani]RXI38783.1 hypothetical protein DP129_11230 [Clostridium tetani]RXI53094.1 hypothetical protein DP131_11600 [Clostridium tetani]RXI67367.1 hypothetical protein DQN76_11540 [Clostridium tetani]